MGTCEPLVIIADRSRDGLADIVVPGFLIDRRTSERRRHVRPGDPTRLLIETYQFARTIEFTMGRPTLESSNECALDGGSLIQTQTLRISLKVAHETIEQLVRSP